MTQYKQLTDEQKEIAFNESVLGFGVEGDGKYNWSWPLSDLDDAMLGVEKLLKGDMWDTYSMEKDSDGWCAGFTPFDTDADWPFSECCKTLNEAIVEACIRICRPDLFEEQS